ncbi:hypothetical protein CRENBAI_011572 [Crenichthys baileyi]|uniref:Uncharacterized protein n=1 Tax=Crenichthys baileyi TaxID=28760 RepID=A0AAV9SQC1_9TELE
MDCLLNLSSNWTNKPCSVLAFVLTCWFPNSGSVLRRLLSVKPSPVLIIKVLPHFLFAVSEPSSWITGRGSVSYQVGKYFSELTSDRGPPWIHRIRLQNCSSLYVPCLSTLQCNSPTGGARLHSTPACLPQSSWLAHFSPEPTYPSLQHT